MVKKSCIAGAAIRDYKYKRTSERKREGKVEKCGISCE